MICCLQLLVAAAPAAATACASCGRTPLRWALERGSLDAARVLLKFGPIETVLGQLATAAPDSLQLVPDAVLAHLPLTDASWRMVPAACPGLGRALPAALAHSPRQAAQVVQRLPAAERRRLRLFALCLGHAQRRLRIHLGTDVAWRLLSFFDA